jgi:hypothetical protein
MTSTVEPPAGILVMRAWLENSSDEGLRVSVVELDDLRRSPVPVASAATVEAAEEIVRDWLERLVRRR